MIVENCLRVWVVVGDDNGSVCRRDLRHCIVPFDVFGGLREDPITKGGKIFTHLCDHVCPEMNHGRGRSWYQGP